MRRSSKLHCTASRVSMSATSPYIAKLYFTIVCLLFNVPAAFKVIPTTSYYKSDRLKCVSNDDSVGLALNYKIDALVAERIQRRLERNYVAADSILDLLKHDHNVEVTDIPFKSGGHSTWRFVNSPSPINGLSADSNLGATPIESNENLMWLAHNAYDQLNSGNRSEKAIVESALHILRYAEYQKFMDSTRIMEMQGRKFADAAFDFSLAGVRSNDLYSLLLDGATTEMKRYGRRKSCRPIDILQVVERLAVAGILKQDIYRLAAVMLQHKADTDLSANSSSFTAAISKLNSGNFSLFSDMPLLWLWRFSARQRKHGNQVSESVDISDSVDGELVTKSSTEEEFMDEAPKGHDSSSEFKDRNSTKKLQFPVFDDPTLPLVVDVGCGFGVSILGLAYRESSAYLTQTETGRNLPVGSSSSGRPNMKKHNFIACDMSHRAVTYAVGTADRWNMTGSCQFIEADAVRFLELVRAEYPGPVECVLINFPTPYQFGADQTTELSNGSWTGSGISEGSLSSGNSQLPKDMSKFMVSPHVINLCRCVLSKKTRISIRSTSALGYSGITANIPSLRSGDVTENENIDDVTRNDNSPKFLLIQTNVEDVAVTMKNIVTQSPLFGSEGGFRVPRSFSEIQEISESWILDPLETVISDMSSDRASTRTSQLEVDVELEVEEEVDSAPASGSMSKLTTTLLSEKSETLDGDRLTTAAMKESNENDSIEDSSILQKRLSKWISSGGERAKGPGWLRASPLPHFSRTETEAMCEHEKKPVHRFLFLLND